MNTDYNQYYTGINSLTIYDYQKEAYRNGQKIDQEEKENEKNAKVKYDLEQKDIDIKLSSIINTSEEIRKIGRGEDVLLEISDESIEKYLGSYYLEGKSQLVELAAKQRLNMEERNKEFASAIREFTDEERQALLQVNKLYQDDGKNILNHSFVNEANDFNKDFEKAACGYAKYLNPEIKTNYDEDVFYNCQDESLYKKELKSNLSEYADNILSYFTMGNVTQAEKIQLKSQLADAAIEYANNIAAGNWKVEDVKAKITIVGVDFTYGELVKTQEMLQKVNEAGVSQIGNNNDTKDYFGLSSNYDTVAFAQLGLRTSQVNYFSNNFLSKKAGELVKRVWNDRTQNTIQQKYTDFMKETAKAMSNLVKENIRNNGNYSSSFLEVWKTGDAFSGSKLKETYDLFKGIKAENKEDFLMNLADVLKGFNSEIQSKTDGFTGSELAKAQLAYLDATKWLME